MGRLMGLLIWMATAIMGAMAALVIFVHMADWGATALLPATSVMLLVLAVGAILYSRAAPDNYG